MKTAEKLPEMEPWQGTSYGYFTFPPRRDRKGYRSVNGEETQKAIDRSRRYLLEIQNLEQGFWVGEIESNPTITAEYVFFMHFMETVDELRQKKMVHYLKKTQLPCGAWNIYFGGPGDLSTTLEAYCAMKLAGENPDSRAMTLARDFILAGGGVDKARVFTKIFLALLGVFPWKNCPALPPEIMLLPEGFPLNIYEMSSWARSTVVPLLILWHHKPTIPAEEGFALPELHTSATDPVNPGAIEGAQDGAWERLFMAGDRIMKRYEKRPNSWMRKRALKAAEEWIVERQDPTGDWGGIMPAMMNSVMALKCLAYPMNHPALRRGLEAVHRFAIEDAGSLRLQSCVSPVWDTANSCLALLEGGLPAEHEAIRSAADWLWSKQTREKGDWALKNTEVEPGGWSFEFENRYYPDNDDTLAVLTTLRESRTDRERAEDWHRGFQWLLSMQSSNGGWGAFDRDNDRAIWNRIPFADHKSMLDPPTADLTGRVLEFLGGMGYRTDFPPVARAVRFLESEQEEDGTWFGRWGVNYLYGTWCALCGLRAIGYDMRAPRIRRAVAWLRSCQNEDGGWGESCRSYDDPDQKGRGESTASQTAWSLMGLIAAGEENDDMVKAGVAYLLRTQNAKGSWDEQAFTGTGFPSFFYLRYHMYRDYFPHMALARYRKALERE
jgi:squalene-hopene/tetraprenyl-beta-curcumene cyclase